MRYGSRYLSGGNAVAGGCCRSPGLCPIAVARNCLIGCFCPLAGRRTDRRAGIGPERGFQSIVTGCLRRAKLRASASLNGVENERACSGHPLTQAQQRIQRAGSVCSSSPFAMAPFGQSPGRSGRNGCSVRDRSRAAAGRDFCAGCDGISGRNGQSAAWKAAGSGVSAGARGRRARPCRSRVSVLRHGRTPRHRPHRRHRADLRRWGGRLCCMNVRRRMLPLQPGRIPVRAMRRRVRPARCRYPGCRKPRAAPRASPRPAGIGAVRVRAVRRGRRTPARQLPPRPRPAGFEGTPPRG